METSTPTPPPPVPAVAGVVRRPGQLTPGWRMVMAAAWVVVLVAWSAVWKTSRDLGLATWWLGPIGQPQPLPVLVLPFVGPAAMMALVLNNVRWLPLYGLVASVGAAVIGIVDLSYVRRLGVVELTIAGCGAAVSVAGLGGTYRRPAVVTHREPPPTAE